MEGYGCRLSGGLLQIVGLGYCSDCRADEGSPLRKDLPGIRRKLLGAKSGLEIVRDAIRETFFLSY